MYYKFVLSIIYNKILRNASVILCIKLGIKVYKNTLLKFSIDFSSVVMYNYAYREEREFVK